MTMLSSGLEGLTSEGVDAASRGRSRIDWELLVERNLAPAYRLASIILGDPTEAQDVTHDSLLRAWRAWPTLRDPSQADAWFQRIVVNACRDRLRHGRRTIAILQRLGGDSQMADPAGGVGDRDAIGRAFAVLAPDTRVTLALRFFADLSVDEIAGRMGSPSGTIKSRIHRGLRQLRAAMEAAGDSR